MDTYIRKIREFPKISFRCTKGKIDIFREKQFHRHYELYLLLGGGAEFISDHARQPLSPFQLVIIPPNEYHRFVVANAQVAVYERCVLTLDSDFLESGVLQRALQGKEVLRLSPHHRIVSHFLYLKEKMDICDEEDFRHILTAIATDIIFLIKQSTAETQTEMQGFLHPRASQIMQYVNEHYKTGVDLAAVAEHFFLSVSAVCHIFKEDFGVSIKKYVTEKRMNEIRLRLQQGEKATALASEFGFSNYSTFYRNYRGYFGVSPAAAQG